MPNPTLRRELGLIDLIFMHVLWTISTIWMGTAAKAGPAHVVLWPLAVILLYVPLILVVLHLSRIMPVEGGLYQWTKRAFGESAAFIVGWNLWFCVMASTAAIGIQVPTYLSRAIGESAAWMTRSPWFVALASVSVVATLVVVASLGLGVGRRVHNTIGLLFLLLCFALVAMPLLGLARGSLSTYHPLAGALPDPSFSSLATLGKLGCAFSGFEYVAILAGECREPRRTIARSVVVASVGIAAIYLFGSSAVLAFVPPRDIDLTSPIAQVLELGLRSAGADFAVPVVILMIFASSLAGGSVGFTCNARLPMVAGWDHLLPEWFARLDRRRGVPVNTILFNGAIVLSVVLLSLSGVAQRTSFEIVWDTSQVFYVITYLVMFAIPIAGRQGMKTRARPWLKVACGSGFLMTLLYVTTAIFPIREIDGRLGFSIRITIFVFGANLAGVIILIGAKRRCRERWPASKH